MRLITDHLRDPAADIALSTAILRQVAGGDIGPTLRLYTPGRVVAFGAQDRTRPGYLAAIDAVKSIGFAAVERLAGGRAAVFHEETVAFAWATPHPEAKSGIQQRFETIATVVVDALAGVGVEAEIGETHGEYCPGRFSVHVGGRKVMGVGQRLVAGAAHVGGVVVAGAPELINQPLVAAYDRLGYDWDPKATGAVGVDPHAIIDAMLGAFSAAGYSIQPMALPPRMRSLADDLADSHQPRIP